MAKNKDELIAEVHARTHIWDAEDQGRLAFFDGVPFDQNPWRLYEGYSHVNIGYWNAGWRREAAEARERSRRVGCCSGPHYEHGVGFI